MSFVPDISIKIPVYILDVVAQKPYSLSIADAFEVYHESPQIILFDPQKGVVLEASHLEISGAEVLEMLG
jgi:bacillithiol system protein YtxJ